jgi:hypothetical protein
MVEDGNSKSYFSGLANVATALGNWPARNLAQLVDEVAAARPPGGQSWRPHRSRSSRASLDRHPVIGGPDPRHDLAHPNTLPDTPGAHPPCPRLSDPAAGRARTPAHTPRSDPNRPPRATKVVEGKRVTHLYYRVRKPQD